MENENAVQQQNASNANQTDIIMMKVSAVSYRLQILKSSRAEGWIFWARGRK